MVGRELYVFWFMDCSLDIPMRAALVGLGYVYNRKERLAIRKRSKVENATIIQWCTVPAFVVRTTPNVIVGFVVINAIVACSTK